jgi:hypothetical protein
MPIINRLSIEETYAKVVSIYLKLDNNDGEEPLNFDHTEVLILVSYGLLILHTNDISMYQFLARMYGYEVVSTLAGVITKFASEGDEESTTLMETLLHEGLVYFSNLGFSELPNAPTFH